MTRKEYEKQRAALLDAMRAAIENGDADTAAAKKGEIEALDARFAQAAQLAADYNALAGNAVVPMFTNAAASITGGQPVDAIGLGGAAVHAVDADPTETADYHTAFMNFVCRGQRLPAEQAAAIAPMLRNAAETTTTTDASAVIPTTLQREIIQEMKAHGNLYAKIRKLNVQGGVEFPILTLKPTASWTGETKPSDAQKVKADKKVSFSYYGLECKIAITLLANVVTYDEFKDQFVALATDAIVTAKEIAIISGDGEGKFLGITKDTRVPAANTITLKPSEFGKWDVWKKKVFGKMKKAYRSGCFIMNQATFDGYIDGMVDANGQPIARVNYGITTDTGESYRFGGKDVETVEDDVIASFDDAANGDVVAVFCRLSDYAENSNQRMSVVIWEDHDTNEKKTKVMCVTDGKLLDANGVLIIKKGEENP